MPALAQTVHGHPLVYLDSASTALKPEPVIEAVTRVYREDCANIHRGVHTLSQRATMQFEATRDTVAAFLGNVDREEVVFTRGTTEAVNLVALAYAPTVLGSGDEIVVSELEHHSNLVPWQLAAERHGAILKVLPIDDRGQVKLEALPDLLGARTKIVAISHVSNSLGSITDVRAVSEQAHAVGAKVVVDGAQAAPHLPIHVREIGADFYAFSGHKVYGPTGAGVLWGRRELLEQMPPWQGGGEMIASVSFSEGTEFAELPHKFEAGTPDIAAVVGLGAALDWVSQIGLDAVGSHENALLRAATEALQNIEGLTLVGTADKKAAVLSFVLDDIHPHDAGTIMDTRGVAVRTGHHCTEPVMDHFGVDATIRASFGAYNTIEDVIRLADSIREVQRVLGRQR